MLEIHKVVLIVCMTLVAVRADNSTTTTVMNATVTTDIMNTTQLPTSAGGPSTTDETTTDANTVTTIITTVAPLNLPSFRQTDTTTSQQNIITTTMSEPETTSETTTFLAVTTVAIGMSNTTASSNDSESVTDSVTFTTTTSNSFDDATTTPTIAELETTSAKTLPSAEPQIVCGLEVKGWNETSFCHPNNHNSVILSTDECHRDQLTPHEWIRLVDSDSNCKQIPFFSDSTCFKPGECGSQFPYYLSGCDLPEQNSSVDAHLCTTVASESKSAYCCAEDVEVEIMDCLGEFYLYRLSEAMSPKACGKVCLSEDADPPTFSFIVADEDDLPPKFEDLDKKAKENLVAVSLKITDMSKFEVEWVNATESLQEKVEEGVQSNRRQKRSPGTRDVHCDVLDGYPTINRDTNEALYVLYVHDNEGKVIAKEDVEAALAQLANSDPGDRTGSVIGSVQPLPKELKQLSAAKPTAKPVTEKGSTLWIAIIIIVGVTAFIVALTFVIVWCYSFSRKGKFTAMTSSQYKEGLVGEDELNSSYKLTGHVNVAMEDDGVDNNQNSNDRPLKKTNNIEMERVEDNSL